MRRLWEGRDLSGKLIFLIPFAIVIYLVIPPLALLFISAFKNTAEHLPLEPEATWTLQNFIQAFSDPETFLLFQNSIVYATLSVSFALAIGGTLVWLIERTDLPGRNVIFSLILLPIAIPGMVKAIGWAMMANPTIGILNNFLRQLGWGTDFGPINIYSLPGIIFVSALSHIPSVTLMIAGAFRNFDPVLEEASSMSGAHWSLTQRFVTLPLLKPSLLAAAIYFFVAGIDDFQIPAILGLNADIHVFSTRIWLAAHPARGLPDFGLAAAYSMLLLAVAMALILAYRRIVRRGEQFAVVTGKGYRPNRIPLGKWKHLVYGGVTLYLLLAAVLPMLTLLWVSFQPFFAVPSMRTLARMSLKHYRDLADLAQFNLAIGNTLIVAPIVATATMFLATLISWNAVRGQFKGGAIPDFLTFINLAVPTVVFGLAMVFVYLSFPILHPIYGTIWILVIAFTTRYLTYTTRLMGGAVIQIHKELEEASQMSGSSRVQTFGRITLPLLLPSFFNGWMWVTIHSLREATLAVMLLTPANTLLASLIWLRWQEGTNYGSVAAISVLVIAIAGVLAGISRLPILNRLNY
jgi:iron(III) transport system permease protein